ncbi:transcriptional antiterminator [Paraburkholderia tropica]|uniref:transcriptional antiterminator n=1 Tax=Paraburkholderia tropica TaxID=92647 RepID=UPI002AB69391|nr:transcriptional antiterminator [Paraburkholderia tropica]
MQVLLKNDIFNGNDGCQYRVVKTSSPTSGWVVNLSKAHSWPVERDFGVLRSHSQFDAKSTTFSKSPDFAFYSENARNRANAAYEAIKPLLLNADGSENADILDGTKRNRLVRARAEELGISKTTIYKYLNKWWSQGQSKYVLIPGSARNGLNQTSGTSGRGRTPEYGRYNVFQMGTEDIKRAKDFIEKRYIKKEHASLKGVHIDLIAKHYSFRDGNGDLVKRPEGEHPSIHQFRHILKTCFTPEDVKRGKKGDKNFDRENKPMTGSSLEEAVAPGHIYEIDATVFDIFLVAEANRHCIIGKPTLYLIHDRKTRLIVGFYLGLENASWTGAMLAILSIAEDKHALCEKYGHPYDPAHWPANGIFPAKFLGDRGEMASRNSDRICDGMEAIISNTQSLLPIGKGVVEAGFHAAHCAIKDLAPGYEPPMEAVKRRGTKYHLDAALTVEECTSLILGQVIKHNTTVMKNYPLSPAQVLSGWNAIPIQLWKKEVEHNGCAGANYTYDYLHLQLLPRTTDAPKSKKAKVTQQGIEFENCVYKSVDDDPTVRQWMVNAGLGKAPEVHCSYDLRLVDYIIVHSKGRTFKCKLAKDSARFSGYSFAEVEYVLAEEKRAEKLLEDGANQAEMNRRQRAEAIVTRAKAATKQARTGGARSARKADTAAERNAEKSRRRRADTTLPPTSSESKPVRNVITLHPSDQVGVGAHQQPRTLVEAAAERPRSPIDNLLRRKAQEKTHELTHL